MIGTHGQSADGVRTVEPLGFLDMIQLEAAAAVIATDSGGVQKEAFFHSVPCVTLRDETEWVETVELGGNRLCPPGRPEAIVQAILAARGARGHAATPYGDGRPARRIAGTLESCKEGRA
jgi:UDP-GlcNAc3NAcA epimerase